MEFGDILGAGASVIGSGLIGGLLRFAPEILKFFNGRSERAHELAMQDLQIKRDKAMHEQGLEKLQVEGQIVLDKGGLEALTTAIKAQGAPTGVAWVDALSASVRPVITYWYFSLFALVKVAMVFTAAVGAVVGGLSDGVSAWQILNEVSKSLVIAWTPADMELLAGILSFWFLDRVIRKNQG